MSGDKQHTVSGNGKSRGGFDGGFGADLSLAHTEQRLLVTEVHFNVPALEVNFNDLARIERRIGTDQKRGIAIEQLRAFAETVGQWRDDDELQQLLNVCGTPHQVGQSFLAESMMYPGMGKVHGLPGLGFIGAELLWGRRGFAVAKTATAGFDGSGIGRQIQFGVFTYPADTDGAEGNLSTTGEAVLVNF